MRTLIHIANVVLYMCEHGARLLAQRLRVGRRKRPELSSVLAWGQANVVQNELDTIVRVVSSAREVPVPSRFFWHFRG